MTDIPKRSFTREGEFYSNNIMLEYRQCTEEGLDIESFKELFEAVAKMPMSEAKEKAADAVFDIVCKAPLRADYEFVEPSTLDEIKKCRAPFVFEKKAPEKKTLEDKIRGAWKGRIAGCFAGKPVEGIKTDELDEVLRLTGNMPMHRYITRADITDEMIEKMRFNLDHRNYPDCVDAAPADDDTNYTVMYQEIIEKYGRAFTPADILDTWVSVQPKRAYFTAEFTAFVNNINGFEAPDSAIYKNPYREWIGAQIRADYFGYINPGDPEAAAEMAFRDACVSHTKNGIYGEMYVAALIAICAVETDLETAIKEALKFIPQKSRFAYWVNDIINKFDGGMSEEECFRKIHETWNEYGTNEGVHTLPNIQIVIASLLYGKCDFGKTVCRAVQTGFDTDCNGATAGSVLGMLKGMSVIGNEWLAPFNGRLNTQIFGVGTVEIEDRVQMTMRHIDL